MESYEVVTMEEADSPQRPLRQLGSQDETAAGLLHCGPQLTVEGRKG